MYATVRRYEGIDKDRAFARSHAERIPDERLEGSGSAAAFALGRRMTFMNARSPSMLIRGARLSD